MHNLTLQQCPKYQQCYAPICPLDNEWKKRKHISGDRVCFYLTEAQKVNAKPVFEVQGLGYLYEAMVVRTPEISSRHNTIKTALASAKKSSSRMARRFGKCHEK